VTGSVTRIRRHIAAPRDEVYRALLDPQAVAVWKVPTGMSSEVHELDAREGGTLRVSLSYEDTDRSGKTSAHTDTYHGRFLKLVPDEQVVEELEFETSEPALQGTMTISITLSDADGGTELVAVHQGVPAGVAPADNEAGWSISLAKLAAMLERPG
jgi:uncharacterized protein YndB with AHSA1/START domain